MLIYNGKGVWKRSLIATKLTMKEAQIVNHEDAQIVSQIDSIVKTVRDTTITPFGTIKVKGVFKALISINVLML